MAAASTCTPSAISSAVTPRRSQHRADDAGLAVRERTHGVEDVRGVACAALDRRHRLRVSGVGVAERNDQPAVRGRGDQIERARKLRREREDARGAAARRRRNLANRSTEGGTIHSGGCTPRRAGLMNGPSKCIAQNFRLRRAAGTAAFPCSRAHPCGDACDGLAGAIFAGGDRRGDKRRGAAARDGLRDGGERLWRAFHYVVAAGAVDVHVDESGNER